MVDEPGEPAPDLTVELAVEAGKVRELAAAVLDEHPAYRRDGAPAPPTFTLVAAGLWASSGAGPKLAMDPARVLHGEQEFEYLAPVRVGDRLTGTVRVAERGVKEGRRGGRMAYAVIETRFVNQRGEPVRVDRATMLETSSPVAP